MVLRHARAQRPPWVPVHDGGSAVARRPLHTLSLSLSTASPAVEPPVHACERCETPSAQGLLRPWPAPHTPMCYHPEIFPPQRRWFVAPAIPPLARDTCWKLSPGRGRIISRLSPPYRRRASWRPTGVRPLNVAPLPQAWSPPVRRLAPGCCRCPRQSRALLGKAPVAPGPLASHLSRRGRRFRCV